MALRPCPDCGHSVSTKADSCPNCGYPFKSTPPVQPVSNEGTGISFWGVVGAVILALIILFLNLSIISVSGLFYLANQFVLKEVFPHVFFHWYFNDIFGGILIVAIVNLIIFFGKQYYLYMNHLMTMLIFTFIIGLFWEYLTPLYIPTSVTDPWDIVAYMFGGAKYWC